MSSENVMTALTEDIMPVTESCIRFFNQVFIGQLSLKMLGIFFLSCDKCQRVGNISIRNEMPMNYSQVIEPFDCS